MTLAIYLAAQFARKPELQHHAAELRRAGITVTSSWLNGAHDVPYERYLSNAEQAQYAREDIDDLEASDLLIWFGDQPGEYSGEGGKFVELGYALGMAIPVVVVSHKESIFAHLADVIFCPDWPSALAYVGGLRVRSNGKVRLIA